MGPRVRDIEGVGSHHGCFIFESINPGENFQHG